MNIYLIMLILIIPAWFLQNCVHEGSHLFIAWIKYGLKPLAFKPYPHKEDGRFVFASCRFTPITKKVPYLWISPLIFNIFYLLLLLILIHILKYFSVNYLILSPFLLAIIVDTSVWFKGYFSGSAYTDGQRYIKSKIK
jgi:hypothetical protein